MRGTEFNSVANVRGMHGSFGTTDVHNAMFATGPAFRKALVDTLPTGNVDLAPTLARLHGLSMPQADGRPLLEALARGGRPQVSLFEAMFETEAAAGLSMKLPTDPDGKDVDAGRTSYRIRLDTKNVVWQGRTYRYFDSARAVRK